MKIDGKLIAEKMLVNLKASISVLKKRGVTPILAVILVGDNPASLAYIKQKQKAAETIGARIELHHETGNIVQETLTKLIQQCNEDSRIHGIIIQRPLPKESSINASILNKVNSKKDVDGLVPGSLFEVPVAMAVRAILKAVHIQKIQKNEIQEPFDQWLQKQRAAVLGRGETAGKPIAKLLSTAGCITNIVHSKTEHPERLTTNASILVSCVGKERAVTKNMVTPGSILIGVGIRKNETGKLRGDYEEEEIKNVAGFYTSTPGGVGPVNVACLMDNLVTASQNA